MIEVSLPRADQLPRDLRIAGSKVERAIKREVRAILADGVAIVKDKLSDKVLHVRSGRLRRSINFKVRDTATGGIDGTIGTNVEYARVHEFGFKGTVTVKEHMRRGKRVRQHSRKMNIPERSFLRSTTREMQPDVDKRIARAIALGILDGALRR